ncbi:serine/threonine protein kinase [Streptomyces venezuelae]|uniref:protein kinase n=1 Tax=Streptomyces venezuelae TaxID=54571 RepID=UPI00123D7047|nr:protein kinase [Streptomyces venezuelae]QES13434.1 serine/threonine protein kinase [Streptomyces venezuelae]
MDDYAGRVLADRYRLPLPPADADAYDLAETRAFDTYSGQEVLVRQVPLPEFVDAEVLDGDGGPAGPYGTAGRATRRPAEPVVRRAIEAAQAAAQIPDHPLLDQVFDVFAEAGSLWIVSERIAARPLAALLAERPLNPYRAAEIGADVLTALRALHAHGWVHRNITARTVLVCDDGRVVLTGLAVGAAEEALCGYAPVPDPERDTHAPAWETPEQGEDEAEQYDSEEYGAEQYGSEEYGAEQYEAEGYASDGYGSGEYAVEEFAAEEYGSGPYAPVHGGADGLPDELPGELLEETAEAYDAEEYGPEGYGRQEHDPQEAEGQEYGPQEYGPQEYRAEEYDAQEYGSDEAGCSSPYEDDDPSPYGSGPRPAPHGADSGRSVTPPTADVRAARAGAIAAYRAGARAAARLGETGALPVQRPAPADPPEPPPAPTARAAGAPQWWAQVAEDDEDDDGDDGEPYGGAPQGGPPPRVMLAGNWSDGPHASRDGSGPVPAGGSPVLPGSGRPALPAGYTAATPDPARLPLQASPRLEGRELVAVPARADRGPTTRLAAERARQTRIAVVGAVTERWAPEQAGPVHENWRLAPPIGPATDLWALGALLYRAVQGHAPYPEDSAAELVQLVCAEPPAFAEECGPLRPVVESLLRQDPTERPDFEELRGWLRSLVRSAPEPEAGIGVVPLPSFDEARLPIVRRRGELVRRRRGGAAAGRHRHKRGKEPRSAARTEDARGPAPVPADVRDEFLDDFHEEIPQRASRAPRAPRGSRPSSSRFKDPSRSRESPRSLGRTLLVLVFLLLGGAVAYAVLFMPGEGESPTKPPTEPTTKSSAPTAGQPPRTTAPSTGRPSATTAAPTAPRTTEPGTDPSGPALAAGYTARQDPEGFRIGVPNGWRRSPINDSGQVRYTGGDFTMIVVPGRDSVQDNGSDPLEYQNSRERELEPWRASSWSGAEKTRRVDIGTTATATGSYWWLDGTGREVFVRNLALIGGGRYHIVQVIGPYGEREKVSEIYEEATRAFRPGR